MAATTLALIRAGIVTALQVQFPPSVMAVNPYVLLSGTPPLFEVVPESIEFDQAMNRGLDEYTVTVRGMAPSTTGQGSQMLVDGWCAPSGPGSVKAALEADRTLGGVVQNLKVTELSSYRTFVAATATGTGTGGRYLVAEWTVVLYGTGI